MYELAKAKGSVIVMCYLDSYGPSSKYGLVRCVKLSKEAISHAIAVLQRLGLCGVKETAAFPFVREVYLTDLGRKFLATPVHRLPSFFWDSERAASQKRFRISAR